MAEVLIRFSIQQLPEGVYLITSEEMPGLVAQGHTIAEALEIAQDVVRQLIQSYRDHGDPLPATLARIFSGQGEAIVPVTID